MLMIRLIIRRWKGSSKGFIMGCSKVSSNDSSNSNMDNSNMDSSNMDNNNSNNNNNNLNILV